MIYIWKYFDEEKKYYFNGSPTFELQPTYVDKIILEGFPSGGYPLFSLEVENDGGILQYLAGDIFFSLLLDQTDINDTAKTVQNFLFDGKVNKYLVIIKIGEFITAGFFYQDDIQRRLTYSQNEYHADIKAIGALSELRDSYMQANQGTRVLSDSDNQRLEGYIPWHFDTNLVLSHRMPTIPYHTRVGDDIHINGRFQNRMNISANFNIIPRWETYKELAKGIGLNFKLEVNESNLEVTHRPNFILRHLFLEEILNETPIMLTEVIEHNEKFMLNSKKWVFAGYRHWISEGQGYDLTLINGTMFSKTEMLNTDLSDFVEGEKFQIWSGNAGTYSDKDIIYTSVTNTPDRIFNRKSEVIEIPFELYSTPQFGYNGGALYRAGAMAYSMIAVAGGGAIPFRHLAVQAYLLKSYARYLLGNKKIKELKVEFTGYEGYDLFKRVVLNDGSGSTDYYISKIAEINFMEHTAELQLTEL